MEENELVLLLMMMEHHCQSVCVLHVVHSIPGAIPE